jgi:hypothetical protein
MKGTLRAEVPEGRGCRLIVGAAPIEHLNRPELVVQLAGVELVDDLRLTDVQLASLNLDHARALGAIQVENLRVSGELSLEGFTACESVSLVNSSAAHVLIERATFSRHADFTGARVSGDLELVNSTFCDGVDANQLTAAAAIKLSGSRFQKAGSSYRANDPVDFSFAHLTSEELEVQHVSLAGSASFNRARVTKNADFRDSEIAGYFTAGEMTVGGVLALGDSVASHPEASVNPGFDADYDRCRDGGKGTSIELYRTTTGVLDLRALRAAERIVNLNESGIGRLDLGQANLCGLLLAGTKVEVLNIDEPIGDTNPTGMTDTDARGFAFERAVSRSPDPVESMRNTFGELRGSREVFAQLSAQLHARGQFERANRAYLIAQQAEARPFDPSWYVFLATGDGRYPLWTYGLVFLSLYALACATFWRCPDAWDTHRVGISYNQFIFALDVVTPSLLDLGYRGPDVFGSDLRRARLHAIFHVSGVVVLSLALVAIGVRLP